ncbi:MAG: Eco57I restriction-modification methylase domain-containing protein [Treponema sp.]|nr:Eco57I restriction-modification methylase domain-containing protein [Treponema sp.]
MDDTLFGKVYNPDVLSCLANLSNDEVFTPPEIVNQMLDMLPQDIFKSSATTFLDPACKTGVFLREIAKRLITGLESQIPDLQERVNHIFHKQLFGIAITELTSLLARRGVYCSKSADGTFSVSRFATAEGNIRYKKIKHTWKNGKCIYCGASQSEYERGDELESHAYEFIHTDDLEKIFNMKFDVIISNPPYQLSVGNKSGNSSKAKAIYQNFISQAMKLNPKYLVMITPSRWMTRSTEGISDEWIDKMLNDKRLRIVHDFLDSSLCFPGVNITGGVNYFLWDKNNPGLCNYNLHISENQVMSKDGFLDADNIGIVIRDINALSILAKIKKVEKDYISDTSKNFSSLISPKDFFTNKQVLTSSWCGYSKNKTADFEIRCYVNKNIHKIDYGWVSLSQIAKNHETRKLNKVYIPAANGSTDIVLGQPFYGEPNSVCSQTYLVIGYDPEKHNFTKQECENIISYIKTRFFRYLVSIKKKTQNGSRGVYQFVPMQDFSKPWTDAELYAKYNLTQEEIDFIESMIRPME